MDLRFIDFDDPLYVRELDLRYRLLREPLGMPRGSEIFEYETQCLHLVAVDGNDVAGCVLFHPDQSGVGRLLQMAVDASWQGRGIGTKLIRHLETAVAERGFREIHLHARAQAVGFYEKLGYTCVDDWFVEIGIPHHIMTREISGLDWPE